MRHTASLLQNLVASVTRFRPIFNHKMSNIPENEKQEDNKPKTNSGLECHERSVIIIGSKGVGKTTMVYRFLRKEDTPKPTIAMDYSFGRKAGTSFTKDTFHVWEVGHLASSLIAAAMTGSALCHSPNHLTILLMVDLSKPETLWNILEESLSALKSALKMSYNDHTIEEIRQNKLKGWQKSDKPSADIFPFRLCIIGGRYDEFKEFDFEKKELIGKTLRGVAHFLGSGLQYHSSKDTLLVRKTKDLLSHYGFDSPLTKSVCFDYNKPLIIPAGSDTWMSIDVNFGNNILPPTLDTLKQIFISQIQQGSKDEDVRLEDPANDPNFGEALIDRLRTQREEEISILLRDMLEGRTAKTIIPEPS